MASGPVVRLIQDAVVVAFWLTHLQPATLCPMAFPRATFEQLAVDIDMPSSLFLRLQQVQDAWHYEVNPHHPMKRAMAAAGIDYMRTGYAIMSLCLPQGCTFLGRMPATERLVTLYGQHRHFPRNTVPIDIQHGVFLGGVITSAQTSFCLDDVCWRHFDWKPWLAQPYLPASWCPGRHAIPQSDSASHNMRKSVRVLSVCRFG